MVQLQLRRYVKCGLLFIDITPMFTLTREVEQSAGSHLLVEWTGLEIIRIQSVVKKTLNKHLQKNKLPSRLVL